MHQALNVQGTLTAADTARHIAHSFPVPAGTGQIDIHFRYDPPQVAGVDNLLCLTLFDPHGFRGAGHRHATPERVHLDAWWATPGYLPGPLPAGLWTVELATHMVLPGADCRYSLEVRLGAEAQLTGAVDAPARPAGPTAELLPGQRPGGPGWYRGELHTHTVHSDAEWDVAGLVAAARGLELDFLALTDHNTISGLAELEALSPAELLLLPGQELTTFWGHALCLGVSRWLDWRVAREGDGMAALARQVTAEGGLFVISHPCSVGNPTCTGCDWGYPALQPGPVRLVEVWNGPWAGDSNNEQGLALYYAWLNEGHRLVATAGGDAHEPEHLAWLAGGRARQAHPPEGMAASSVVYADKLTQPAILQAMGRGHLYLSAGPRLSFTAAAAGRVAMMGDALPTEVARLDVAWEGCPPGAQLRLVGGGRPAGEWPAGEGGKRSIDVQAGRAPWWSVELRAAEGQMLAVTNPIFLGAD